MKSGVSRTDPPPPRDGITMTTTRKGWRDSGDILAMKNNQNVQNTYLKNIYSKINM